MREVVELYRIDCGVAYGGILIRNDRVIDACKYYSWMINWSKGRALGYAYRRNWKVMLERTND